MTTPPRRRPTSANPTSRPRRLAGRSEGVPVDQQPGQSLDQDPTPEHEAPPAPEPVTTASSDATEQAGGLAVEQDLEPPPEPDEDELEPRRDDLPPLVDEARGQPGFLASRLTTRILLAVIVVLALVCVAGGAYLAFADDDDDRAADEASSETRILQISAEDAQVAAAAAGEAAYTIIATSWKDYDAQVDEAADLMTTTFAEEYRQTAGDVRDELIANKTEVQVSVLSQGVVSATETEVRALVFLNQFVTKDGKSPVLTPYRAVVTVVNTDDGWLVADIETK